MYVYVCAAPSVCASSDVYVYICVCISLTYTFVFSYRYMYVYNIYVYVYPACLRVHFVPIDDDFFSRGKSARLIPSLATTIGTLTLG